MILGMPKGERAKKDNKRVTKKLGRVAQSAIIKNDDLAEEYVHAVRTEAATTYVGGVAMADTSRSGSISFGDGLFSVKLNHGGFVRAKLRGILTLPGRARFNPMVATAIHSGTPLVLEDMGVEAGGATHRIVAILTPEQADAARPPAPAASGVRRSSSDFSSSGRSRSRSASSNSIFERRRSSNIRRNAEARAAKIANLNVSRARTRTAKGKKSSNSNA